MKVAELKGLKGAKAPVYLIVSKDDYDRKEGVDSLIAQLLPEKTEFSLTRLDGAGLKEGVLLNELHSSSFLAERKVVVVRQADKLNKAVLSEIEGYIESPTNETFLILEGEAVDSRTTFCKKIEKLGVVCNIADAKPKQKEGNVAIKLADWAAASGKTVDAQTAKFMVQQLGSEQTLLTHELEKLICYVGDRDRITMADVQAICSCAPTESIWELGDAIFKRDASSALKVAHGLLEKGVAFFALTRQIRTQFQTKFQICSLLASGGSSADVQKEFPYMRGFILDTNISLAQTYGFEAFKKGLIAIDETELKAKNSQVPQELLTEMLIAKLTV